jgi:hypothetical protein
MPTSETDFDDPFVAQDDACEDFFIPDDGEDDAQGVDLVFAQNMDDFARFYTDWRIQQIRNGFYEKMAEMDRQNRERAEQIAEKLGAPPAVVDYLRAASIDQVSRMTMHVIRIGGLGSWSTVTWLREPIQFGPPTDPWQSTVSNEDSHETGSIVESAVASDR